MRKVRLITRVNIPKGVAVDKRYIEQYEGNDQKTKDANFGLKMRMQFKIRKEIKVNHRTT